MSDQTGKNGMMTTDTTVSAATAVIQRNRQIMRIALASTVLSFLTFSITLTSSRWVWITYPSGFFSIRYNLYIKEATYGMIWECVFGRKTQTAWNGKYRSFG